MTLSQCYRCPPVTANNTVQEKQRIYEMEDIVHVSGPSGLRLIKGFHDEQLRGEWKGHRSSRLGDQYRVIYKVEEHRVSVVVMDVTAHDYRRQQ